MRFLRLSNFADYGVVVMTMAVRVGADGARFSAARIAEETGIPFPTVSKLLGQLRRSGLLVSQRGHSGGFALARPADQISLADIVEAIDGPIGLTHCSHNHQECGLSDGCGVRPHWPVVNRAVRTALSGVTLASVSTRENISQELYA